MSSGCRNLQRLQQKWQEIKGKIRAEGKGKVLVSGFSSGECFSCNSRSPTDCRALFLDRALQKRSGEGSQGTEIHKVVLMVLEFIIE